MRNITFKGCVALPALVLLLLTMAGCAGKEKQKVAVLPTLKPLETDSVALQRIDIAMMSKSIVDALNVGERLDSATYDFRGILTDGQGNPLYIDSEGNPGVWSVHVDSPGSVVMRNVEKGELPAEDLRVYVAQAVGLTDADVIDAGIAEGTKGVQAVVYQTYNLRLELTLSNMTDKSTRPYSNMTIAFIRLTKK